MAIRYVRQLQCGALMGLALAGSMTSSADEALRDRIHREYRHQSYMLVESANGAALYLFNKTPVAPWLDCDTVCEARITALELTRSDNPRSRVLGLLRFSGMDDPAALDMALALFNDPDGAVRQEARQLILDHPRGASLSAELGLQDNVVDD